MFQLRQPRVSHLVPPIDNTGVAPGRRGGPSRSVGEDGIRTGVSGWLALTDESVGPHQWRFRVFFRPQFQLRQERCPSASNGARNVVPRVAGVEFVADSTQVDPESSERAFECAVFASRSLSEDVHSALEFNLWTPRDSEDGAVLQGDPRRMSQCPTVVAEEESGEIGMAHVSPRVSTTVVSCRGVAQRASMVHAAVSSNRFSALADDEVEVHPDSGSETVIMGDVPEVESDEDTQSCFVSGEEESEDIPEDPLEIPAPPVGVIRAAFL